MSLLSIIQNCCRELKIQVTDRVLTSTEENVLALYAALLTEGKHLALRQGSQQMKIEASHVSLAALNQGDIRTIAPGFDSLIANTFWNRTLNRKLDGVSSPQEWAELLGREISSSFNGVFYLRGNKLLITPIPTAGETLTFEYRTTWWIEDVTLATRKAAFTADDDAPVFPEAIMELGVTWRWLEAQGLDYAERKRDYEIAIRNFALRGNQTRATLAPGGMQTRGDYAITEAV